MLDSLLSCGYLSSILRLSCGYLSFILRLSHRYLSFISPLSQLYLTVISALSHRYLSFISLLSPEPHLPLGRTLAMVAAQACLRDAEHIKLRGRVFGFKRWSLSA